MDVNFSQIGQDFARQEFERKATLAQPEEQKATSQFVAQNKALQNQDSSDLADNNERQQQASINIESAVSEVSEFVQARNRQLAFSIDEESKRSVVKVTDSESGEVIRQIPSEEVLALSERIKELQTDVGAAVGVLFNKQV